MRQVEITLLAKPGCHLCEDAREAIGNVRSSLSSRIVTTLVEVDILADAELARRHAEDIPVVLVNGRRHAIWRVDENRLAAAVEKAARPGLFGR